MHNHLGLMSKSRFCTQMHKFEKRIQIAAWFFHALIYFDKYITSSIDQRLEGGFVAVISKNDYEITSKTKFSNQNVQFWYLHHPALSNSLSKVIVARIKAYR